MERDDLISRAAAIEALGERPYNWTDSDSEIAEVCAWESHKSAIENIPAVDAVPVEWLKAQIRSYTGDVSDIGKSARNGTIKDLIRKWQKEQEAR